MKPFTTRLVIAQAGLYILMWLIPPARLFAESWEWAATVGGFTIMGWFFFRWIVRASSKSPLAFITAVNGVTVVKLMTSLGVVTAYLALGGSHKIPFAMGLFAAFVISTTCIVIYVHKGGFQGQPKPGPKPHQAKGE